jgi:hypothetical protein
MNRFWILWLWLHAILPFLFSKLFLNGERGNVMFGLLS